MSLGLVGRKVGMTRIFAEDGATIPVTVLDMSNNRVTQIKTAETDGYSAVQVTFGSRKANRVNKAEAGHFAKAGVEAGRGLHEFALDAAKQTHSAPVQKITIIPRTSGALGYTMQVDEGNHYLMNKEELENKIATLTGGRAAEEVVFHSITTGASNDIEQATKLARAMLTRYGMSDEFDMVALETVNNQYLGGDTSLACSAQTQCEIDQKVVELVKAQHAKAVQILTDNRAKLDELAQYLYQKETITGEEFMDILNKK